MQQCKFMDKKTKIVATLGLVSDTKETLRKMVDVGMNVGRLNFSHGSYEWHGNIIKTLRELSQETGKPIGILADLQGPRIRTVVEADVEIKTGDVVEVGDIAGEQTTDNKQQATKKFLLDVAKIVDDIEVGNEILIEDGIIKVVVKEKNDGVLLCEVIDGGIVRNHKGVNIPDAQLHIDPVTQKDQSDLEFALKNGVDFVALSFVSDGNDIENLRKRMKDILGREDNLPQIVAKIERKEAIKNLDDIIMHTDVVMVARGDLGIEIETSKVAVLQKQIIKKCLENMKPVIVATQMLNSMIDNPRPTRAEVSDVTNAVIDHADAVMLSGESASGKYPVESVETMAKIICDTESSPFDDITHTLETVISGQKTDLAKSAYDLARNSKAKAIVMGSESGKTARTVAHFRAEQPVYVVTDNEVSWRQLSLVWGVESHLYNNGRVFREDIDWLIDKVKQAGTLAKGDTVVVIMGRVPEDEGMHLVGVKQV
jgi:pyruvate kinase